MNTWFTKRDKPTRVYYRIFSPDGHWIMSCATRTVAKETIDNLNADIPSWHYDELHRYGAYLKE